MDREGAEATFIPLLYVGVGLGEVLPPILLLARSRVIAFRIGLSWTLNWLGLTVFGTLNYFTHIGFIIYAS